MAVFTPSEYAKLTREQLRRLSENRVNDTLIIANEAKALVQLRIQTSGTDAKGSRFEPYVAPYAEYGRRRKGYQSNFVDFTRTGQLWASIHPEVISETKDSVTVEVKPRDSGNNTKLQGQFRKRGNILELSQDELDVLTEANRERILKYLNA